jgi:hypothetical protein
MTFPGAPPPVDPRALRPSRAWYVVAMVIVVIGVVVGVGLFGLGILSVVRGLPKVTAEFEAGSPTTVHLTADRKWAIYVDRQGLARQRVDGVCTGTARGDGSIDVRPTSTSFEFSTGRRHWQSLYTIDVTRDGDYELTCRPSDPAIEQAHYAVGDAPNIGGIVGWVFGGIAALIGVPCLALVVGGVIALVVGLRRSSHKKRLQQQYFGYPPPPAPPR